MNENTVHTSHRSVIKDKSQNIPRSGKIPDTKTAVFKESFNYTYPKPDKAYYRSHTISELPTEEYTAKENSGSVNFLAAEAKTDGIQFPTADSSKAEMANKPVESPTDADNLLRDVNEEVNLDPRVNNSYKFDELNKFISSLSNEYNNNSAIIQAIKDELSKLFNGVKCERLLYTINTDNLFFGIRCYPEINADDVITLCNNPNKDFAFTYSLELDSKLFNPIIGLSSEEIVSLIVYTIYHTAIASKQIIVNIAQNIIDYETSTYTYINTAMSLAAKELLCYAFKDAIMKAGSPFTKQNGTDIVNDNIMRSFKLSGYMDRALRKLIHNLDYFQQDADDRAIILGWVLRVIDDYEHMRLHAYKQIQSCLDLTGSKLEFNMLNNIKNVFERVGTMYESAEPESDIIARADTENKNLSIRDCGIELLDMRNAIDSETVDADNIYAILTKAWNRIIAIDNILSDPYLERVARREWENLQLDYMSIKDEAIRCKDYLERQHNTKVPEEFYRINESSNYSDSDVE